jgi:hypothetical protein
MNTKTRKLLRSIYGVHGLINALSGLNVDGSSVKAIVNC